MHAILSARRRATGAADGFEALDACHRETLARLADLAAVIARLEHGEPDARLRGMAEAIDRHFAVAMREHHEDEERHVFPPLLARADEATRETIACLKQDHAWLDADWHELAPLLDAAARGHAWYDLGILRDGADTFSRLARAHIALEESLIYPPARSALAGAARTAMDREMAARRRGG